MKRISVISVNFNHNFITEQFLASVFEYNAGSNLEIIIVDNGSTINPVPVWKVKYPSVKFIRSDVNLGFAGGNNLAISAATGEYLFLVNNDTEFTSGLVEALAATLDLHPEVGMVCPKIRYFEKPDMLQYAGFTAMNYYTARNHCIGQFETDNGQYDNKTGATSFAHGAAVMLRREVIDEAGPMAENYFLYYEEMDWCERVRKAGYTIWVNMAALIYHKESVSVGAKSALKEYFMNRNRILFVRRNCSAFQQFVFWPYFISVVVTRNIANYIRTSDWQFIPVLLRAVWWNMTNDVNSSKLGFKIKQNT